MSAHTRYVVRLSDSSYVGSRRYDYSRGSYTASSALEHARLFTRKQDAAHMAKRARGSVVEVEVHLVP